jgi:inorganic phosphate transporter, PiT family
MTEIAATLPGSIEPARGGGPKLDHGVNPLTLILFFGVLAAGLLFVAYSIHSMV